MQKPFSCRDRAEKKHAHKVEIKTQGKTNLIQQDGGEERQE